MFNFTILSGLQTEEHFGTRAIKKKKKIRYENSISCFHFLSLTVNTVMEEVFPPLAE